jgi:hypothetical protein
MEGPVLWAGWEWLNFGKKKQRSAPGKFGWSAIGALLSGLPFFLFYKGWGYFLQQAQPFG